MQWQERRRRADQLLKRRGASLAMSCVTGILWIHYLQIIWVTASAPVCHALNEVGICINNKQLMLQAPARLEAW
jgi:hypothetical protein